MIKTYSILKRYYPERNWFYIKNLTGANNTVSIYKNDVLAPSLTIETSTDGYYWHILGSTEDTEISNPLATPLTATIPANGKLYLRCLTNNWADAADVARGSNRITITSTCELGGNIMSLLYGQNFTGNETEFPTATTCIAGIFVNNATITDASDLILPAQTLTPSCYENLFFGCSNLSGITCLATDLNAAYCLQNMLTDVAVNGTLYKSPNLPTFPVTVYPNTWGVPSTWTVVDYQQ